MAVFLKFKDRSKCRYFLAVKSPGGIMLGELPCILPVNHQGVHRARNGAIWDNWTKRLENMELMGDPAKKPKIFLGR